MKPTQFILMPVRGQPALAHAASITLLGLHDAGPRAKLKGIKGAFKVLDSIHENGVKLVEMDEAGAAQIRATQPGLRVVPVVYHQTPKPPRELAVSQLTSAATLSVAVRLKVVSQAGSKPVAGAMVVAFTDFARRLGAQGTTNKQGVVALNLPGGAAVERLSVYPESGHWSLLKKNVQLMSGMTLALRPLDLSQPDGLRTVLGAGMDGAGAGVKVGVVDSGVALDHPDLRVSGGLCTVLGEREQDYGPLAGKHGTHVAGIIAAKGSPPKGVRGLAPAAALYSYRVFPDSRKIKDPSEAGASNFAIAKAIDRAVRDGCDLINLSLGGGPADEVTQAAIEDARAAGSLVIAATGNDGRQPVSFPARDSLAVAVTATGVEGTFPADSTAMEDISQPKGTDPKFFLAKFSNVGSEVDLTSIGVDVVSTVPGVYAAMSGTSMACPAATGAAARLLAAQPVLLNAARDAQRSAAMLNLLYQAAQPVGFGAPYEGHGLCK